MEKIHPRKTAECGQDALRQLYANGRGQGTRHLWFSIPAGRLFLLVVLMFSFRASV